MRKQKIVIEITESNKAPKVIVDSEEVKVVSLNYNYKTNNCDVLGIHCLNLVMPSMVNGILQTKGIAF
ncbi:hypothetical protein SFC65_04355 [Priestia filamentosa]|uniref:hypothetical protein n=1 Tax=Priestia filamentosa TaxID=1402861 RepID=UPI0039823B22